MGYNNLLTDEEAQEDRLLSNRYRIILSTTSAGIHLSLPIAYNNASNIIITMKKEQNQWQATIHPSSSPCWQSICHQWKDHGISLACTGRYCDARQQREITPAYALFGPILLWWHRWCNWRLLPTFYTGRFFYMYTQGGLLLLFDVAFALMITKLCYSTGQQRERFRFLVSYCEKDEVRGKYSKWWFSSSWVLISNFVIF